MGHDAKGSTGLTSPPLLEMVNRSPVPNAYRLGSSASRASVWSPVVPPVIAGEGNASNTVGIIRGSQCNPEIDPTTLSPDGLNSLQKYPIVSTERVRFLWQAVQPRSCRRL
jgi:hypothetical protein